MTEPQPPVERAPKGKITFVITSLYKGGAETQAVRVAIALKRRGWVTRMVTVIGHNDFEAELSAAEVPVDTLAIPRGRYDPRSLIRLTRLLRSQQPDIVCTFMYHANVLGRVAARISGVPHVVSSIRNQKFGGEIAKWLVRATDGLADVTTTNSTLVAQQLVEDRLVRPERMVVVPNAIELSDPSVPYPRRSELVRPGLEDSWLWLSVGRLEAQKAHHVLFEALARLRSEGHSTHLALVGVGSLEGDLKALAERTGIADDVTFLGYRNDIRDLMAVADGFVLASLWEGLPNAIIEAGLARLPVVATDVGGVSEILQDGLSGIVVQPDDPTSLLAGMRKLMTLPEVARDALIDRAFVDVSRKYAAATVMERWDSVFSQALANRLPRFERNATESP